MRNFYKVALLQKEDITPKFYFPSRTHLRNVEFSLKSTLLSPFKNPINTQNGLFFCTLKSISAICWCNTLHILMTNKLICKIKKKTIFHYMIIPLGPFSRKFALFSLSAVQYSATDTFCISYCRASFFCSLCIIEIVHRK